MQGRNALIDDHDLHVILIEDDLRSGEIQAGDLHGTFSTPVQYTRPCSSPSESSSGSPSGSEFDQGLRFPPPESASGQTGPAAAEHGRSTYNTEIFAERAERIEKMLRVTRPCLAVGASQICLQTP